MESVFNINPSDIKEPKKVTSYSYSFLNDIFDIDYHIYYSLIESLEIYQLKNIYMFMYLRSLKINKETSLEKMGLHKYISEPGRLDQVLKEYIQRGSLLGDMVEMVATFQQNGIKANRIMQTVLAVVIFTLESPVRQKQSNATIVKRLDISRNPAE